MQTDDMKQQAHDLAVIWTRREFDLHTEGIPLEEWDKVDEALRMDKLLHTYQQAYTYFKQKLPEKS